MYVINNLRREVNQNFSKALSDWYVTKVSMTTDHIADRFLDRSASVKKTLRSTVKFLIVSLNIIRVTFCITR